MARAIAGAVVCAALLCARTAGACGGFFCDSGSPFPDGPTIGQPPAQTAERIVFVQEGSRVRSYIQIRYDGDPVDFAWVVPVPSRPEIDVADPTLFGALEAVTAPVWVDASTVEAADAGAAGCACSAPTGCEPWQHYLDVPPPSTLQIESTASIGAYSVTVVTAERTSDLTDWLSQNVYTVPRGAEEIIGRYVEEGFFFVALRLQASADVKAIEPLVLEFDAGEPCVPLRLTAIASRPGMDVTLFVVGDEQATPTNYGRALLREDEIVAAGAAGYGTLLSDEVDAAGGRAFATEFAAPTSEVRDLSSASPEAEEILRSGRYLTRLRTRIDPDEMTDDPLFGFDPDLADVSNVHVVRSPLGARLRRGKDSALASLAPFAAIAGALLVTRRRR